MGIRSFDVQFSMVARIPAGWYLALVGLSEYARSTNATREVPGMR